MIKIRLSRQGAKGDPFYRIVATDIRKKRGGAPVEVIGYWNPRKDVLKVDKKRMDFWISQGAQNTPAVKKLISK